jgi:catechol 2,3-dioxygenase-like lactoylglutathione lyase family enzyme
LPPTIGMYTFMCSDAAKLAAFWAQVLGKDVDPGASAEYATLDFEVGPTWLFIGAAAASTGTNRFMLDLVDPEYEREAERISGLGAERVGDHGEGGIRFTVFRDPEGNAFRLFAPRPEEIGVGTPPPSLVRELQAS